MRLEACGTARPFPLHVEGVECKCQQGRLVQTGAPLLFLWRLSNETIGDARAVSV
jgi:hypothetical protein